MRRRSRVYCGRAGESKLRSRMNYKEGADSMRILVKWPTVLLGANLLLLASGVLNGATAGTTSHKYDGKIQFDISKVPFSRYGSYIAFSHLKESASLPEGVYLRTLHGAISRKELFRVELLRGRNPIPFKEIATPTLLRLEAPQGYVEICIAEPKVVRVRGAGVEFRLRMPEPQKEYAFAATYDFALPISESQWEVNSFSQQVKYMLTTLNGSLVVDAPWQGTKAEHVVADFLPDLVTGTFEGVLEEFPSVWLPHEYETSFEDALDAVRSEYRQWLSKMPPVPEEFAEAGELAAYVNWESIVSPEGHLTRPAMLMSKNWMTNVWSWDNCFNMMALIYGHPELAWDQFMLLIDNQGPQGAFPDWINDQVVSWSFTKPPIHGWALGWVMRRTQFVDRKRLAEVYEPLCRWTDWYLKYRDNDHDGVPEYNHGNDSGWDNATIFRIRPPIEAPDLSAYLVLQMDTLAEIARTLGKPDEARSWRNRADELLSNMLARCWNGKEFVAPRAGNHMSYPSQSLILYLPIILGNRLPKPVLSQLVAGLKKDGRFLTENGIATESLRSQDYVPDGYWLGPVWAPAMMVITEGLEAVGEKALATDLRLRFCRTVAKYGMAENFDAITGVGLRDPAYTWTSSVFLIFAHDLLQANSVSSGPIDQSR